LRFGEEGKEGRRYFSYILRGNKKLPQFSQRQQENQKKLSNTLFKMKTRKLKTKMTLSTKGPCLQLLLKTSFKGFTAKKMTPDSAITGDCSDVASSHKVSTSTAEGGLVSPRHGRLPGQHHSPAFLGMKHPPGSSLNP